VPEVPNLVVRVPEIVVENRIGDAFADERRVLIDRALVVAPFVKRVSTCEDPGKIRRRRARRPEMPHQNGCGAHEGRRDDEHGA
jgi:hypothetical protein